MWMLSNLIHVLSLGNNQIKITYCDETKERALDSQIVRAEQTPKKSHIPEIKIHLFDKFFQEQHQRVKQFEPYWSKLFAKIISRQ